MTIVLRFLLGIFVFHSLFQVKFRSLISLLLFIVAEKTFILFTCIFLILDRVLKVDSLDVGIIFDLLDRHLNSIFSHAAINKIEYSDK